MGVMRCPLPQLLRDRIPSVWAEVPTSGHGFPLSSLSQSGSPVDPNWSGLSPLVHNNEFQACESSRNVCCACSSQGLARDPLSPLLWTEGKPYLHLVPSEQEGLASQGDSPFLMTGSRTSASQVGKLKRGGFGRVEGQELWVSPAASPPSSCSSREDS